MCLPMAGTWVVSSSNASCVWSNSERCCSLSARRCCRASSLGPVSSPGSVWGGVVVGGVCGSVVLWWVGSGGVVGVWGCGVSWVGSPRRSVMSVVWVILVGGCGGAGFVLCGVGFVVVLGRVVGGGGFCWWCCSGVVGVVDHGVGCAGCLSVRGVDGDRAVAGTADPPVPADTAVPTDTAVPVGTAGGVSGVVVVGSAGGLAVGGAVMVGGGGATVVLTVGVSRDGSWGVVAGLAGVVVVVVGVVVGGGVSVMGTRTPAVGAVVVAVGGVSVAGCWGVLSGVGVSVGGVVMVGPVVVWVVVSGFVAGWWLVGVGW